MTLKLLKAVLVYLIVNVSLCFLWLPGWNVIEDQLEEVHVAMLFCALEVQADYLEQDFRDQSQQFIVNPEEIQSNDCVNAYLYLKYKLVGVSS